MDISKRQITKIAREVNKLTIRTMRESGIGSGEFDLIHLVRHNPGISQKEVSKELNMDKGATARRVANLEQKGYLVRKDNPNDKRSRLLYATEKAESLKNSKTTVEAAFYEIYLRCKEIWNEIRLFGRRKRTIRCCICTESKRTRKICAGH